MTPLSVHQEGFGKTTSMEWFAPIWSNFFRIFCWMRRRRATTRQVGETPPDSTHSKALETRSSRCVTAAVWNACAMAARVSRFSMPSQFSEGNTFCSGFDSSTTALRCFSMANRTRFSIRRGKTEIARFAFSQRDGKSDWILHFFSNNFFKHLVRYVRFLFRFLSTLFSSRF